MTTKTPCPRDCPGRYPGCGAHCETFKQHRAERAVIYDLRRTQVEIGDLLHRGYLKTKRL